MPRSMISPSSMTRTLSALRMVLNLWAMTKLVLPRISLPKASCICISVRVSTLLVASSSTSIAGSATRARAMLMSCLWPWLRLPARSLSSVS